MTTAPTRTSSPPRRTFAPLVVAGTLTWSPTRSTSSWGTTVSVPAGTGAPVMMRTAWPGLTAPSKTEPAGRSAMTWSIAPPAAGRSALATA